jgi:hypothetical protein
MRPPEIDNDFEKLATFGPADAASDDPDLDPERWSFRYLQTVTSRDGTTWIVEGVNESVDHVDIVVSHVTVGGVNREDGQGNRAFSNHARALCLFATAVVDRMASAL